MAQIAKQIIRKQLSYSPDRYSLLDGSIQDIKNYLDRLEQDVKNIYPEWTTIKLDHHLYEDYGSPACDIAVYGEREETDEEEKARKSADRKRSIAAKKEAEYRAA